MHRSKAKPPHAIAQGKSGESPKPKGTHAVWCECGASHILSGCARSIQSSLSLATAPKAYGMEKSSCASSKCQYGTVTSAPPPPWPLRLRRHAASRLSRDPQRPQSMAEKTKVTWQMRM